MHTTPLNAWHRAHYGRMVDFAGWDMPVQYTSIVDEHNAVRSSVGLFDISHMGRLQFFGDTAESYLNTLLTNDTRMLKPGDVRYSLVCREDGGILDDVLVYRMTDRWELVVNASNREKIVAWLPSVSGFDAVTFVDRTIHTGMIAVQGPQALTLVESVLGLSVAPMKYYTATDATILDTPCVVSRTGYTGEDGFELTVPADRTVDVWERLMDGGTATGIVAAGLGCRDTLRLEAAMPLYGHELNEQTDPLTAGLGFAVKLAKADFIGRSALERIKANGLKQVRVGLVLDGRRIAREETPVCVDDQTIGKVTSGTFSPTLQKSIAMASVTTGMAQPGTLLEVNLRGTRIPAVVTALPFYKRSTV